MAETGMLRTTFTTHSRPSERPQWRGPNFNARIDSIETGRINEIGVPYRLIITHLGAGGKGEKKMVSGFVDLIPEMKARGCRVNIVIQD